MNDQKVLPMPGVQSTKMPSARKPKRERIELIEVRPRPEWFVRSGREWFLRLEITGLLPRRWGPFASRRDCLLFLDWALDTLTDTTADLQAHANRYIAPRRFGYKQSAIPIVEDALGSAYRQKGR